MFFNTPNNYHVRAEEKNIFVVRSVPSTLKMPWTSKAIWGLFVATRVLACPNDCSFKGTCNIYNQCECFAGFTDADCSRRVCPLGPAWAAPAIATDEGHQAVECANAGTCNRKTGTCQCFPGYVGNACQRLACPASAGAYLNSVMTTEPNSSNCTY